MILSNEYPYNRIQSTVRHVFGSHEAKWAFHLDGWYEEKYRDNLNRLGFKDLQFEFTQWRLCPNIIIKARKTENLSLEELKIGCFEILKHSLVDDTETGLYKVWCDMFLNALSNDAKVGLIRS